MFLGDSLFSDRFHETVVANYSYRLALGSIILFFLIGLGFMAFIKDPHKRYVAGERAPYPGIYDKKEKPAKDIE